MEEEGVEVISKEALEGVEGDMAEAVVLRMKSKYSREKPQVFVTDRLSDSFMQ